MKLDTLYKRTRTGAIQFWEIKTDQGTIIKKSGQFGTSNPLIHSEQCKGKNIGRSNETTPEQQAEAQAQSDWRRKKDEGYKSLKDLGVTVHEDPKIAPGLIYTEPGYLNNVTAGQTNMLESVLERMLPQFNTDSSGQMKPMLAPTKPFVKGKAKYPAQLDQKLDGVRTFAHCNHNGKNWKVNFTSRSGKPYNTLIHLQSILEEALDGLIWAEYNSFILDGEVYLHGLTLEEINERVKKSHPETGTLEFWVFDLPVFGGKQERRTDEVHSLVKSINSSFIKVPESVVVNSDTDVQENHDRWVQDGFEGAMLKDLDGTYEPGQRSRFWTKVKMFEDHEYDIVGYKLGQRGVEDLVFKCLSPHAVEGYDPEFEVKLMGTRESKQRVYDTYIEPNELQGKQLTVKHFGLTKYGIPFLPTGKAIRDAND